MSYLEEYGFKIEFQNNDTGEIIAVDNDEEFEEAMSHENYSLIMN